MSERSFLKVLLGCLFKVNSTHWEGVLGEVSPVVLLVFLVSKWYSALRDQGTWLHISVFAIEIALQRGLQSHSIVPLRRESDLSELSWENAFHSLVLEFNWDCSWCYSKRRLSEEAVSMSRLVRVNRSRSFWSLEAICLLEHYVVISNLVLLGIWRR
jgi:hypothetical protein